MKSNIVEFHKGKVELNTMDDELPILIFVILMSDVEDLIPQIFLIEDYISNDDLFESEKRLVINLKVYINDIFHFQYLKNKKYNLKNMYN